MSSGISALCRTCPRLASRHAGQAVARSALPRPRPIPRPNRIALRRPYSTVSQQTDEKSLSVGHENKPGTEEGHARNQRFRNAYRRTSPERVEQELKGPFVHSPRQYSSPEIKALSDRECRQQAKKLAGAYAIWQHNLNARHFLVDTLGWGHIHNLLKEMTPRSSQDDNRVSAMRIVVSSSLIESQNLGRGVNFISSVTGILEKLRLDHDAKPSAAERQSFILRGGRKLLSQAADELSREHQDMEIYELGDVGTTDYHAHRLWPTKASLPKDEQELITKSTRDRLWLHPEPEPHWITKRFSDIQKPEKGNSQAFESYITELTCGRIRRDLVVPLYYEGHKGGFGKNIDIEADRARLIMEAFEDPANKSCITNASLKRALHHLASLDGYRVHAKRLFRLSEESGLPMDTETYNIMLEGIVGSDDFRDFYKWIAKMKARQFEPNARTWLLFLRLVKKDDERRLIVASMFERNLLTHQSVRRGVAAITAPMDAYQAFMSGKSLNDFIREHNERFGYKWYTREALIGILKEYFRYFHHRAISAVEWSFLVEQRFECGERLDTQSMNDLLKLCGENGDWVGAIWCVDHMSSHQIAYDDKTYMTLLNLACKTGNYYAFTAVLFHGVHDNALYYSARQLLKSVLLSTKEKDPWKDAQVPLFTKSMAEVLSSKKVERTDDVAYQIFALYQQFASEIELVPAEPLAMSLLSALTTQHEVAALEEGEMTNEALKIPMKKRGDSDEDVKETYRFDTNAEFRQKRLPKPQSESKTQAATQKTAAELEEAVQAVEEIFDNEQAAAETEIVELDDGTVQAATEAHEEHEAYKASILQATTPKKPNNTKNKNKKGTRFGENPFTAGLNTAIPKATTSPKPHEPIFISPDHQPQPEGDSTPDLRYISPEEAEILAAIRRRSSVPHSGSEAKRIARDAKWDVFNPARPNLSYVTKAKPKPWLLDGYYEKSPEEQLDDTAVWLQGRYKEIKDLDSRNRGYSSRQRLLQRARNELGKTTAAQGAGETGAEMGKESEQLEREKEKLDDLLEKYKDEENGDEEGKANDKKEDKEHDEDDKGKY